MNGEFFPLSGGRHVIKSIDIGDDGVIDIRLGPRYDIDADIAPAPLALEEAP